ncbi:hypothetical protein BASA81_002602 [Batrachochytrium salamandrivorans]|nr:hypothetical protein BASA81_002602 [Batrachochytrium salamandrivorans]
MLVLGAGSIGTLFACDAARRLGSVSLLVRSRQGFSAVRVEGEKPSGQINLLQAHELRDREFKVAVFACKQHDLSGLSQLLAEQNCRAEVGVSLCNGLGALERIRPEPFEELVPAVTYAAAKLLERGVVRRTALDGAATVMPQPRSQEVAALLQLAIPHLHFAAGKEDMDRAIWKKLLANVVINPLTALFTIRNGLVPTVCREFIPQLVDEFNLVCPVPDLHLPGTRIEFVQSVCALTGANTSSMLADVTHHRRTEIDALNGAAE